MRSNDHDGQPAGSHRGPARGLFGAGRPLKAAAPAAGTFRAGKAKRTAQREREAARREALREARAAQDPTARAVHTRNAVLRWAHQRYQAGDSAPACGGFMKTPGASFDGVPLELGDLQDALEYLTERDLVELHHPMHWTDPGYRESRTAQRLSLTRLGIDCAESGTTVSDFLYPRPPAPGDTYNTTVHAGAQGTQIGRQNTMHNTWGLDANALLRFAGEVLAKLPELGLDAPAEAELEHEADALRDVASARQPDPTALRRAYDAVMNALGRAPESTAGQWLHEAGTAAIDNVLGGGG
ncbi:hypothetical protein [Streptomyces chrestomyceticus]|uniref:Uncharacterized protein n=1 Tax=Streptomyces chrestomyceticus TaxID=68185 RepID=A0ABU7WQG9_9ACTN